MLPPVLEVFIVWHPHDSDAAKLAEQVFNHFMSGATFSGVIGGGIQVSLRSDGWAGSGSAPRPIYADGNLAPNGISPARFVAVVPLLAIEMAVSVQNGESEWHNYVAEIRQMQEQMPDHFGVFPCLLSSGVTNNTALGELLGHYQVIVVDESDYSSEAVTGTLCRDLTQGIAQLISPDEMDRLTVFISHTKRHSEKEGADVERLVALIREVIRDTRLNDFFDANDLQPGRDWEAELKEKSATSAMLAVRTDLYSSREWCQREVVVAKISGMPLVMMDAIGYGEDRGSFLMDHVPRVAMRKSGKNWRREGVYRTLNLLVDECLKRAIWMRQKELAEGRPELDVAWWAPHAPEPLTLSHWIDQFIEDDIDGVGDIRIIHPDPPLGPEERKILVNFARKTRLGRGIDIMTPRQLATRGG